MTLLILVVLVLLLSLNGTVQLSNTVLLILSVAGLGLSRAALQWRPYDDR